MRIGLVNDMNLALECLRRVVESSGEHTVAWTAENGQQAVDYCQADLPDLVLMDLVMPIMNGAEATHEIMAATPVPILVVTASMGTNGDLVYEAMGYGALDATVTPTLGPGGNLDGAQPLLEKIQRLGLISGKTQPSYSTGLTRPAFPINRKSAFDRPPFIAIGSSTGGPQALANVLSHFDADFPGVIGIVQHVDPQFAPGMAEWLNARCALNVQLAQHGQHPEPGNVYMAGHDAHMRIRTGGVFEFTVEPTHLVNRPSVDVFFKSLASHWPKPGVAMILTGMGRDGAEGLKMLRERGWRTIAQDQESSVVYGMPKAAVEIDAAHETLPIDLIGPTALNRLAQMSDH
ncbi:chemotaxis response regulator protein-glutamate methylesterase [Cerasicoccus maritimus]|uniref:chemotaxis response regulator protein-glutamate methylesterase n=1 Tax=Cerasicoccus maritimus TaxID=490089 RepID=UPI0028526DA5|nr:chemotaxis response regulator protein-glutamate methylesterase [Cerasicoccus maritimus]